ncbi:unnamed protein product, partial [Didymodactylos carnosus]
VNEPYSHPDENAVRWPSNGSKGWPYECVYCIDRRQENSTAMGRPHQDVNMAHSEIMYLSTDQSSGYAPSRWSHRPLDPEKLLTSYREIPRNESEEAH